MLAFERAGQGFRDGWNGDLAHHMDLADAKFFFSRNGFAGILHYRMFTVYIWIFLVEVCDITGMMVFGLLSHLTGTVK